MAPSDAQPVDVPNATFCLIPFEPRSVRRPAPDLRLGGARFCTAPGLPGWTSLPPPPAAADVAGLLDWVAAQPFPAEQPLLLWRSSLAPQTRLLSALAEAVAGAEARIVSPFDAGGGPLGLLPEGCAAALPPADQLDALLDRLARGQLYEVGAVSTQVLAISATALKLGARGYYQGRIRLLLRADRVAGQPRDRRLRGPAAASDPRWPNPASALDALRERVFAALQQPLPEQPAPNGPVLLHLLHGWGGGSARWVRDMARADRAHHHLLLRALSTACRSQHGEALELVDPSCELVLARWPLDPPITSTAVRHAAYREVLHAIIERWQPRALLLSSLIGHALDALETRLPTIWIAHDPYPFWPHLGIDPLAANRRFDAAELAATLREAVDFPFLERDPRYWLALREALLERLVQGRIPIVAPSRSLLEGLCRLAPELTGLPMHKIAHGIDALPGPRPRLAPARRDERLRLVLPGRIRGAKGAELLGQCLPALLEHAELLLLGAGREAEAFFGIGGVHVIMDYAPEDLAAHIERFRPHAGLLLPTLAESFSYTLSELWALGLPVIATRLGALAERIEAGRNGLLVEPEPAAVIAAVAALRRDPERLGALQRHCAEQPQRSCAAMLSEHCALLPAHQPPPRRLEPRPALDAERGEAAIQLGRARRELEAHRLELEDMRRELDRRGDWGHGLQRQLDERSAWAASLQRELEHERASAAERAEELARLASELEAEQACLRARESELSGVRDQLDAVRADLAASRDQQSALERQLIALRQQADALSSELSRTLNSRSMRLTRPLRVFAERLRHERAKLQFRRTRLSNLLQRGRLSLRTRGLRGSLAKLLERLQAQRRPPQTSSTPPDLTRPFVPFALPTSANPRVSVVIPVYNKFDYTHACLRSIAEHGARAPFEVIVVDDGSSDQTRDCLRRIRGLRYLRNPRNLGFVGACNAGAAAARGAFLMFLNNDTVVTPGWLDALLDTVEHWPRAGLVGSMLIYPDGRLQEAGGIVFSDGSGWNYGRFGDPEDPAHRYPREVDYCSGAAILLPRALFERLGGFDTRYSPAYYEDTDLAFAVREAGLRVIYQPASRIIHFEGITSGTDTASGTKRYQLVNQAKFVERRAEALSRQPAPGTPIWLAREHRVRGRVLVVDACTPEPDKDSGSVRMVELLRLMAEDGWKVVFFADNRAYVPGYSDALAALGIEVLYHPWLSDPVAWFVEHGRKLDTVLLSRHYVASQYVALVRRYAPQARLLFDTVDLHYLREQRAAALAGDPDLARAAERTREAELRLVRDCDLTLVVSHVERELLAVDAPGSKVEILSNIHEIFGRRRAWAEREDIVFVGGYQHPPNVDAALWLVREILPRIRAADPAIRLHLIGSKAPAEVQALHGEGVVFHGYVEDIAPWMDGCRIALAPLRYGAGVKGKVNMAMSYGLPVVATSPAVEGMHARPGEDVLVADTAEDFAAAVLRAYHDPALWLRLSEGGLANVRRHFSRDAAREALRRILPSGRGAAQPG